MSHMRMSHVVGANSNQVVVLHYMHIKCVLQLLCCSVLHIKCVMHYMHIYVECVCVRVRVREKEQVRESVCLCDCLLSIEICIDISYIYIYTYTCNTYTYTYTYTYIYTCTYVHVYAHPCIHTCTQTHVYIITNLFMQTRAQTHSNIITTQPSSWPCRREVSTGRTTGVCADTPGYNFQKNAPYPHCYNIVMVNLSAS